jgi:pimeloyl-ACP methyl ester carboxylesterase
VSLPTGATSRRPVVVVIHGAGDRPERQCRSWRRATSEYPFIICPTGRAWPRYTHIGGAPLLEYIDEALDVLAARYPHYVDTRNPLLVGFSLGAAQVTALAVQFPARFPRIALVEGATKAWSGARASAFYQGGGRRVLFACGQDGVRDRAEQTAKRLTSVGLDTHVVFANVGHKFGPPLQDVVGGELTWLMDGDERWPSAP